MSETEYGHALIFFCASEAGIAIKRWIKESGQIAFISDEGDRFFIRAIG